MGTVSLVPLLIHETGDEQKDRPPSLIQVTDVALSPLSILDFPEYAKQRRIRACFFIP